MRAGILTASLTLLAACTGGRTPGNPAVREPLRAPLRNWDHVVAAIGSPPRTLILGRDGAFLAWDARTGEKLWKSPIPEGDALRFLGMDGGETVLSAPNGRLYWISAGSGNLMKEGEMEGTPRAFHRGTILATVGDGREVSAWNRAPVWKRPVEFAARSVQVQGLGSCVLVSGELAGKPGRFLQVLDMSTGRALWKTELPEADSAVTGADPLVLIHGRKGVSARDPVTGREIWQAKGGEVRVRQDGVLIRDAAGTIETVELATGEITGRERRREAVEFADAVEAGGIRYEVFRRDAARECWMEASAVGGRTQFWKTTAVPCASARRPMVAGELALVDLGDGLRVYKAGR